METEAIASKKESTVINRFGHWRNQTLRFDDAANGARASMAIRPLQAVRDLRAKIGRVRESVGARQPGSSRLSAVSRFAESRRRRSRTGAPFSPDVRAADGFVLDLSGRRLFDERRAFGRTIRARVPPGEEAERLVAANPKTENAPNNNSAMTIPPDLAVPISHRPVTALRESCTPDASPTQDGFATHDRCTPKR